MERNSRNHIAGGHSSHISSYTGKSSDYGDPYATKITGNKGKGTRANRQSNSISPGKAAKSTNFSQDPKNKSRLIIRDASLGSMKSTKRYAPGTTKSRKRVVMSSYTKQVNLTVKKMREDLDPENIMDGIEKLDLEVQRLDEQIPPDFQYEVEISEMVDANKELKDKVNEIALLVKNSLAKINKPKANVKVSREGPRDDPELISRRKTRDKIHKEIRKAREKMTKLRAKANSRIVDPREEKFEDNLRTLNTEVETLKDELRIHKKQTKRQNNTLSKEQNSVYQIGMDTDYSKRIQEIKEEIVTTKEQVKTREKELKEIESKSQHKTAEFLKIQKEFRKVHGNSVLLKHNKPTMELQKKQSLKDEEKFKLKKQKDFEKQYRNEETLHSDLMKRFDKFISSKQAQINEVKAKMEKITDQNKKLGSQMKDLKEMAKKPK
ncbi:unnamed protein product [Moneuplotes crassus]|uniref:Uncharacterized protein n=1 Tax=Euplotes crassus TaxID=5936 RepID=A0AAD1UBD5_EUPCR|nr:unnamed protein product [Moneuplotes crassus]